jgi:cytochrome c oxidase cbb3-type subunit 1
MVWNIWMTIAGKRRDEAPMSTAAFNPVLDRPAPRASAAE